VRRLLPALHPIALWCALAGCAVGFGVALMTVVSVFSRALFSMPIQGDVELSQFGIALCVALCLPWCQLRRGNIIVDFFTQKAGPRTVRGLDAFGSLLLALMTALLAWRSAAGAVAVYQAGETTMIFGLPMWISYAALAPGLALTAVIALVQVLVAPGQEAQTP
jgi:TRAP-type C4-dicarboxylate transport system permease small subunit